MPRLDPQQGFLFGASPADLARDAVGPASPTPDVVALARRLHPLVHLGTCSWAFPGWQGLVYAAAAAQPTLARHGLAAYAAHPLFRTVALDRAFYALLSRDDYAALASLVPDGFRFLVKAHQSVTRPDADDHGRTFGDTALLRVTGRPNPRFLDAAFALDQVIAPAWSALGPALGPIVFQFPPLDLSRAAPLGPPDAFLDRLSRFLHRVSDGLPAAGPRPVLALELRNREVWAGPRPARLAAILRDARWAPAYASHPSLPPLDAQDRALSRAGLTTADHGALVVRWLLHPSQRYEPAKERYAPFTELVDPDPAARAAAAALIARALAASLPVFVVANNKAEGSAPRTILELARLLDAQPPTPAGATRAGPDDAAGTVLP